MYQDAEERKKELMAQNEMDGLMFKMKDDPRITKVGKFIRKTSIDELPQFWNVLKGDMSLVGPRPEVRKYVELYTEEQRKVLSVRPGITDYASIEYVDENTILGQADDADEAAAASLAFHQIAVFRCEPRFDHIIDLTWYAGKSVCEAFSL